jgi:UDP-2,3-diacylglucosamine hydrolase
VRYQRYRKIVNLKWVQRLFLWLPLSKRRKLALKIHNSNPHRKPGQYRPAIADVTSHAVESLFNQFAVPDLIHGHTHRMGIHEYAGGKKRYVLSDWHNSGSYIEISKDGIMLTTYNPSL